MVDFFDNGLWIHCHLAKNELSEFSAFNNRTEDSWKFKDSQLNNQIDEILKKFPEKDHCDIIENYSWDMHLNQVKFPNIHRESLIITIFNFLEHQLSTLCEILYDSINSELKLNDIHGNGVERALLFLKKVAKIDLSNASKEIEYIKRINKIRNIIVHNGGFLRKDSNALLNIVNSTKHLYVGLSDKIIIEEEFIESLIIQLTSFFNKLEKEIEKHTSAHTA